MENKSKFMLRAIELSIQSAKTKGGPFGCVIVKNDKIIAEGYNQVTSNNCLLYTSPSPRDRLLSRMPSSA